MAYVKCVDCDYAGNKAKNDGTREQLQKCEKRAPEANQAEEGLARYPIVELSDGGCHEGKGSTPEVKTPKPQKNGKK